MKAVLTWIVQAAKDVYSFVYTEAGTILSVFKTPDKKWSAKRVIALALVADTLFSGVPTTLFSFLWAAGKVVAAVVLFWIAESTKT